MAEAKLPFDLRDVRNFPTALVALFALVWLVIGGWFALAQSGMERSVAGVLFTVMFLGALAALFLRREPDAAAASGLTPSNVREGASAERIQAPRENELGAPDGSYLISQPPSGWKIEEHDFDELVRRENREQFGTDQNPYVSPAMQARAGRALLFRAPETITIRPIAGRTRTHGRAGTNWASAELRSELWVVPFEREQPPLFVEFPFAHTAFHRLGGWLSGLALDSVEFGRLDRDGAPVMVAEASMTIEDVLVDGQPVALLRRRGRLVVVRGDIRDYAIAFIDTWSGAGGHSERLEIMQRIVASFRPLRPANVEQKRAERRREADAKFAAFMEAHGRDYFGTQLQFALQRVAVAGLATPAAVQYAVETLQPFRDGSAKFKPMPGTEERAAALWVAFDAASRGDAAPLRAWMPQGFAPASPAAGGLPFPAPLPVAGPVPRAPSATDEAQGG